MCKNHILWQQFKPEFVLRHSQYVKAAIVYITRLYFYSKCYKSLKINDERFWKLNKIYQNDSRLDAVVHIIIISAKSLLLMEVGVWRCVFVCLISDKMHQNNISVCILSVAYNWSELVWTKSYPNLGMRIIRRRASALYCHWG